MPIGRKNWVAVPLAILAAASPPAFAAPPAAIDACALLTPDEVSDAVGREMAFRKAFDNGITNQGAHSTTCMWVADLPAGKEPDPNQRLGGRGFVVLSVMNWPGGPSQAAKFLDDFYKAFEQHDIDSKPVAVQVGADDSLWWGDGVAARKDNVSFGVSVAQFGDRDARKPQAESLAKLVAKRLPAKTR
jgi:hypothetical protein